MYMEATGHNQSNTAILASPLLPGTGKPSCFSFYYHMNGSGIGRMAVAVGGSLVWLIDGSHGSRWNSVSITVNFTGNSQVIKDIPKIRVLQSKNKDNYVIY